jgi:hypothetical protein
MSKLLELFRSDPRGRLSKGRHSSGSSLPGNRSEHEKNGFLCDLSAEMALFHADGLFDGQGDISSTE